MCCNTFCSLPVRVEWPSVAGGREILYVRKALTTQCTDSSNQFHPTRRRRRRQIINMTTPNADTNDNDTAPNPYPFINPIAPMSPPGHAILSLHQIKYEDLIDNYLKVKTLLAFLEQQQRAAVLAEGWGGGCERCGKRVVVLMVRAEMLRDELAGALWGVRKE